MSGGEVEEVTFERKRVVAWLCWKEEEFLLEIYFDGKGNVEEVKLSSGKLKRWSEPDEEIKDQELKGFASRVEKVLVEKWRELWEELD